MSADMPENPKCRQSVIERAPKVKQESRDAHKATSESKSASRSRVQRLGAGRERQQRQWRYIGPTFLFCAGPPPSSILSPVQRSSVPVPLLRFRTPPLVLASRYCPAAIDRLIIAPITIVTAT
ncbi:hypothetical protein B0H17DRAFT_1205708 [Mycena rosella]|uniref:Uncharacterized protein n=1 Tax=Mycena rosella TaxID=1033263 RepID=A0AAD7D6I6_MYCRO|nr:hypothetical protein B0H17DRAFT_1205708 [Mycena rosella]